MRSMHDANVSGVAVFEFRCPSCFSRCRRMRPAIPAGQEAVVDSAALANRQRIDAVVRIALIVYSVVLLVLAGGFAWGARWATELLPFSYGSRGASFAFAGSMLAAAAAPTLWCALTKDFRA